MRGLVLITLISATLVSCASQRDAADECTSPTLSVADLAPESRRETQQFLIDGTGDAAFGNIVGVALDSRQWYYVADKTTSHINVFDGNGKLVRTFGNAGRGPGEFDNLSGITIGHDTIYVMDRTVQVFDSAGKFIRAINPRNYNMQFVHSIAYAGDKIAFFRMSPSMSSGERIDTLSVRFYDRVADSVQAPAVSAVHKSFMFGGSAIIGPAPLQRGEFITTSSNATLYRSVGDRFRIQVVPAASGAAREIVGCPARVPISEEDVADEREVLSIMFAKTPPVQAAVLNSYDEAPKPASRPVIAGMIASPEGDLLIQRMDVATSPFAKMKPSAKSLWLILTSAGEGRGHIEVPVRFRPFFMDRCSVTGVLWNEDDVQSVVRYRWSADGPGGKLEC